MNKHFLKNIRDNIPEPIKHLTAPIFRNKLLNNRHFKEQSSLLDKSDSFNEAAIKDYQLNQLRRVLENANNNVPYYTELFKSVGFDYTKLTSPDDIKVIPFLTKDLIRKNFDKLTSTHKVEGGYYVATTGGSTGEPLKVLLDYDSIFKENAFIYHFRKRLGYSFEDKLATFRGIEFGDKLWKFNPMHNELVFSPFKLSKATLQKFIDRINDFNPQFFHGYLSSLYFFARLLQENNIKLNIQLKGIFLISENIDIEQRKFLEEFFSVKSSTFYGHSERCVIAEELTPELYKPNPFYGYTELVEQADNNFEIVSTGFLNRTMPLIRYKTADVCETVNGLIKIQGRWNVTDVLIGVNDEKIFHSSFNFHSEIFKNVTNYQFVQQTKGKADLLLVVNKEFNSSELQVMKREIDKKTKDVIDFELAIVDSLQLSSRGKFKRFISNIQNG
jgi:phenylacetate-CoA ligase